MHLLNQIVLLFGLNLLDALLTIFWVRNGVATESNQLMAGLLDIGNWPFLIAKIAMGAVTAVVLAVYIGLMALHVFTGLTAFGYVSNTAMRDFVDWSGQFFAFVI